MASGADVVVIGGGVVGTSIAFHLARLGAGSVTLLERSPGLAAGATGRSGALVRTHYTNAPEAAMAQAALPWFEGWADRVGGACGFVRTGFLQVVDAADTALLKENTAVLQGLGVDTRVVDAAGARALEPALAIADGEFAAYEPRSGYADPVATTESLAAAARRLGVEIRLGSVVRGLCGSGSRVTGVKTARDMIAADVVVVANGCWSVPLLARIGVNLPIEAHRAQRTVVARPPEMRGERGHLTVIDRRTGVYTRPHGVDGTLVGLSRAADRLGSPDGVDVEPGFPERARDRLALTFPAFAGAGITLSKAGPLDVTPDHCALIGPVDGMDGIVLATGMSGSGFKKAPAIGACVAELIVEGAATTAPIEAFDPARFTRGAGVERRDYTVGGEDDTSRDALVH
jgi:sarcosine oxidase subunit beta